MQCQLLSAQIGKGKTLIPNVKLRYAHYGRWKHCIFVLNAGIGNCSCSLIRIQMAAVTISGTVMSPKLFFSPIHRVSVITKNLKSAPTACGWT